MKTKYFVYECNLTGHNMDFTNIDIEDLDEKAEKLGFIKPKNVIAICKYDGDAMNLLEITGLPTKERPIFYVFRKKGSQNGTKKTKKYRGSIHARRARRK